MSLTFDWSWTSLGLFVRAEDTRSGANKGCGEQLLEIIAERVIAMIRGGLCQSSNKVVLAMLGEAQQYIYVCSNRTNVTSVSFQSAVSTGITFQKVPLHVPSAFYCVQNLVFSGGYHPSLWFPLILQGPSSKPTQIVNKMFECRRRSTNAKTFAAHIVH